MSDSLAPREGIPPPLSPQRSDPAEAIISSKIWRAIDACHRARDSMQNPPATEHDLHYALCQLVSATELVYEARVLIVDLTASECSILEDESIEAGESQELIDAARAAALSAKGGA